MSIIQVIIPTYNRVKYLERTLNSVLNQSFDSYEIIVVDAASTDGTKEYLERVQSPMVRVVRYEDNLGMFGNMNRALSHADVKYVSIFHDDDIMAPNFIEKQYELLSNNPKVVMAHTASYVIDEDDRIMGKHPLCSNTVTIEGDEFVNVVLREPENYSIVAPSVCLNLDLIEDRVIFDPRMILWGDLDCWIRLSKYGSIAYIKEHLIYYRVHKESGATIILEGNLIERIKDREYFEENVNREIEQRGLNTIYKKQLNKLVEGRIARDIIWVKRSRQGVKSIIKAIILIIKRRHSLLLNLQFCAYCIYALLPLDKNKTVLLGRLKR